MSSNKKDLGKRVVKREALHRDGAKALFGDKCQQCGYDNHWEILEFHHIVPRSISGRPKPSGIWGWKWERVREEILKECVLLCPNCHAEVHLEQEHNNGVRFRGKRHDE